MYLAAYSHKTRVLYLVLRSNGTFERTSRGLMRQLMEDESALYLPEFAGTRLRYVEAILEMSDVQYPEIVRLSYGTVAIDRTGRVDYRLNAAARRARLAQAFGTLSQEATARGNVIFAQDAFTLAGTTWQPSAAQQRQILAIFTNAEQAKRFQPPKRKAPEAVSAI
jgi:hypothetical protein